MIPQATVDRSEASPDRPSRPAARRFGCSIRALMAAVAAVAIGLGMIHPLYVFLDAEIQGPRSRSFQHQMLRRAKVAQLVGRPEADVATVLGPPCRIFTYAWKGKWLQVLAYGPSRWSLRPEFWVFCDRGRVVELYETWY